MSKLLQDILNEPAELLKSLQYSLTTGKEELNKAVDLIRKSNHIFITGIGSSWHAGMAVQNMFYKGGLPAHLIDAGEILHFVNIPSNSVIIVLSRSGESHEIVQLVEKAKKHRVNIIGITNACDSYLGKQSDVLLFLNAAFDHLISITMYSALGMVGCVLASVSCKTFSEETAGSIEEALNKSIELLPAWQEKIRQSTWLEQNAATYFLARGSSFASASETRLLWEEAAKQPATALTTDSFRHGPQEIIKAGVQLGVWLDSQYHREKDLQLIRDLEQLKCRVLTIGQNIPDGLNGPVITLPFIPDPWQFLIDIIPGQLAAEHLSRVNRVDCDSFNLCPYIIRDGGRLL